MTALIVPPSGSWSRDGQKRFKRRRKEVAKRPARKAAPPGFCRSFRPYGWCCRTGLNCRPLHYQWSALPLSYGSMLGAGISLEGAYQAGRSLPQGHGRRKRGWHLECIIITGVWSACCGCSRVALRHWRVDPVPHGLDNRRQSLHWPDHHLEVDISRDPLKAVMYGVTGSNLAHLCTPFDRP